MGGPPGAVGELPGRKRVWAGNGAGEKRDGGVSI